MRLQHVETQYFPRPVRQQLPDGDKIAFGFRHLVAFDLQEAVVHPDIGHAVAVKRAGTLRKFVLVVRKHQIDAAAMNVELLAEMLPRHRRALDMPAWTTLRLDT